MKFEKLKPNKIKIIIDADELVKWGVSIDALVNNAPETREMFMSVLKQAEEATGFNCNNSRLVVEASAHGKGELTLFVTKVDSPEERALFDKISAIRPPGELIKEPKKEPVPQEKVMIELETLDDVIAFSYAFENYYGGSLYLYDDMYYMIVDSAVIKNAAEFGNERSSKKRLIVEEHGKIIARGNAFFVIRNKFAK